MIDCRDKSATAGLYELAQAGRTTTAKIRELVRAGSLPWPLRDRKTGKAVRPYRWLVLELLTHAHWISESKRRRSARYLHGITRGGGSRPLATDDKSAALSKLQKKGL
jgi:hypothetical protein